MDYGFDEKKFRYKLRTYYSFDNHKTLKYLYFSAGTDLLNFKFEPSIDNLYNAVVSLFDKKNYAKYYEKTSVNLVSSHRLFDGVSLITHLGYEQRKSVYNNTNYSFKKKDVLYEPNILLRENHDLYKVGFIFDISLGQKYQMIGKKKRPIYSENFYPNIKIEYNIGFGANNKEYNFDKVKLNISESVSLANMGSFDYHMEVGGFINKNDPSFVDYNHFNGNRLRYLVNNKVNNFYLLDYYDNSTTENYSSLFLRYNDGGFLMTKIPLLNKLQFKLNVSYNSLFVDGDEPYSEFAFGFSNIGFGKFRLFKVMFAQTILADKKENVILFGISM